MVRNHAGFLALLMALLKIGSNPLLLPSGTQLTEVEPLIDSLNVHWAASDTSFCSQVLAGRWLPVSLGESAAVPTFLSCRTNHEKRLASAYSGVVLHPTSGTSGRPLICIRDQTVAVAEGANYVGAVDIIAGVRIAITTPLSHAFAYGFGMVVALITDSTLVLDATFNPKQLLRRMASNPCDLLTIVPPMLRPLTHLAQTFPRAALPNVVFYAGSRCEDAAIPPFETAFGAALFAIYGSTETGAISTNFNTAERRPGVGRVLPNVAVKVRSHDSFAPLASDHGAAVGEILVRSTSMMQGYWGAPQAGTWFPPGDVGFVDSAENIHLVGRTREIINVGGLKLDPSDVETVLRRHTAVIDAAAYPGLDAYGNEIVVSAVHATTSNGVALAEELRNHCSDSLLPWKVPVTIHIVNEIPRTPSGKCMKHKLPGCSETMLLRRDGMEERPMPAQSLASTASDGGNA